MLHPRTAALYTMYVDAARADEQSAGIAQSGVDSVNPDSLTMFG
jgi:hypothetical protein